MELIDKAAVVAEIAKRVKESEIVLRDCPSSAIFGLAQAYKNVLSFLDTLEVKEANDAYKQGYNDAIDKFCKFMQSCEGYVVSGNKCNYENFIKFMEEQKWKQKN